MNTFRSFDGTLLASRVTGTGEPLVVVPGGPMQDSVYLDDLGGLSDFRSLHILELRGTGASAVPEDPATYRVDRQVDDVEAYRSWLGLETMDLLGHSAGGSLAILYAARYPERVRRLVLLSPSMRLFQFGMAEEYVREAAALRDGQPGMDAVLVALDKVFSGAGTDADEQALTQLSYGRWDAAAQKHAAERDPQTNWDAVKVYYSDGLPEPDDVQRGLAKLAAPVLIVAGELDFAPRPAVAAEAASRFFRHAETAVAPGGGHFGWLDNPAALVATVTEFLDR